MKEVGAAELVSGMCDCSDYGKTCLSLDQAGKREDSVRDIDAIPDWTEAQPGLDGDRFTFCWGNHRGFFCASPMLFLRPHVLIRGLLGCAGHGHPRQALTRRFLRRPL